MSFFRLKRHGGESPGAWGTRAYVFVAVCVLAIAIFLYTNSLIRRLERQTDTLSRSIAGLCATSTYAARENEELRVVFAELIEAINFPIVITDIRGIPITWKGLPIDADPASVSHEDYLNADRSAPEESTIGAVIAYTRLLDERRSPIPMTHLEDDTTLGFIHYGDSSMISEMRYVPVLELAAFGILVFLGFLGFRNAKLAEMRSIWVGLAKETAHQLGTPISSLMGWVELLREPPKKECETCSLSAMADDMQRDLERLEKISQRFNQIGSVPKTRRQDLVVVLREAVEYLSRRIPGFGKEIRIIETYSELPQVDINRELIEWVVENLVKNSVEALPPSGGRIEISTEYSVKEGQVRVIFTDDGRGLSNAERRRIFEPGYSTKRKGWGLGLALARRIVEEYHKGRLYLGRAEVGKGCTFVVSLPTT